jgi:hypothetical protein
LCDPRAQSFQRLQPLWPDIGDDEIVPGFEQAQSDRLPHQAGADQADPQFRLQKSLLSPAAVSVAE